MKRYRIYENNLLLLETDDEKTAMRLWRESHQETPDKYHEVYECFEGIYIGIRQFKPYDKVGEE